MLQYSRAHIKWLSVFILVIGCAFQALADTSAKGDNPRLVEAVQKGDLNEVGALLDGGADVNTKDTKGQPILIIACRQANLEMVRLLLSKGASIDIKDRFGWTPVMATIVTPTALATALGRPGHRSCSARRIRLRF